MDISVIVPFYNEEGYVEQCVQSLLSAALCVLASSG